ncbi:MAG TPA: LamG-like jellyroll fold domain-containing protein [Rugosimonospora sp.]|nr:LamG-like jellyroll fold domain-containing protein [Rugosimonospora sp.]
MPHSLPPCGSLGAPQGVTAVAGGNSATAAWQAPSTGTPTSYLVRASAGGHSTGAKAVPGWVLSATLTGLAGGVAQTLSVTAVADCGAGPAASAAPVTPTGATHTYAATVLGDAPVGYYRLGESPDRSGTPALGADSADGNNPLSYSWPATVEVPGALVADPDSAATFSGNCCGAVARPPLPVYGSARTVEAWVKPGDGYLRWVAGWGDYSTNGGFQVGTEADNLVVNTSSDELRFAFPGSIVGGDWHQIAVTYSGTTVTGYLDGASLGSRDLDTPLDTPENTVLYIGAGHDGASPYYGGIDELSVYPSALSSGQVYAHFLASGHSRPGQPHVVFAQPGEDNEMVVSWGAATATGGAVNRYTVTALAGGVARNAVVVAGTKTAARVTGLAGGTAYTFRVVAGNAYGEGPAAVSAAAATPTGPAGTYATSVLADAPRAYYRLGEGAGNVVAADSSGSGRALSLRPGTGTFGQPGAIAGDADRAVRANGTCCLGTAYPLLPVNSYSRTVEAWVKPGDGYLRFFTGWGDSDTSDTAFDVGADGSDVVVRGWGDDLTFPTPVSLLDGAWHHVAVTYSGGTAYAYLDGLSLGAKRFQNTVDTTEGTALYVGSGHLGYDPYVGGLDEVAVYPTALSAARIAAHFAASGHARPAAVTGLSASPDVNQVSVSWTAPAAPDGITSYQVTALVGGVARTAVMVPGTVATAVLTGLSGGTAYTIRVVGSNRYGDGPAATTAATVTPTGSATTYAGTVLAAGPSAYYRLGEVAGLPTAANSAGSGRPLSVGSTGSAWHVAGALRGDPDPAVSADGGCCIGTSTTPMPRFDATRTVQAWVRPLDGYRRWFAGWGVSGDSTAFSAGLADSQVLVSNGSAELAFPTPQPLTDGVWHQVTVAYSAGTVTAYLDGSSLGSKAFAARLDTKATGHPLYVGSAHEGREPFYGGLDEVAVYPSALSAAQVAAQFDASGHARPGAATGLSASGGTNAVNVSWNAPPAPDGITSYQVTALVGGVARNALVVPGTATSATLTGLAGGTAYTVRVVAANAYGGGPAVTSGAATPTGTPNTYAASVLADGPVAYYRLGEPAGVGSGADSAGGMPLSYGSGSRGVAGAVAGDPDTAAQADGGCCIGSSQTVPRRNDLSRTVEAWVKPADGYPRWLAGWGRSVQDEAFNVGLADSQVLVSAYADDLSFPIGRSLVDGIWHHVAVTVNGSVATAYVDGQLVGARQFHNELDTAATGLRVGAAHDGSAPFYGGLDEVAVYPSALSAARIAAHFAASGHGRPAAVTAPVVQAKVNALTVSWTAAATPDGVSYYLLTALAGGQPKNSVAVAGSALTGTLTGLAGGTAYTVQVVAVNGYGRGPAATTAAATPTGAATTYAGSVLADAPSAYYRLGEAAGMGAGADSSPASATLGYGGAATLGRTGALVGDGDGAVNGNGGCCVGSARNGALPSYNSARTVEAWVKPGDGYQRLIAGWGSSRTNRAFNVGLDATRILVSGYGDDRWLRVGRPLNDGAWHHIAVVYTGSTVTAYVDGLPVGTKSFASKLNTVVPAGDGLHVGAGHDNGGAFYGDLDEVAVYPSALSAARIAAHFAASGNSRPGGVTGLSVSTQDNAVRVSWTAAAGAPTRYLVTAVKAGVPRNALVVAGSATTALLTGLAGGTAYTVKVVAANAYGDGPAVLSAAATPTGSATTYAGAVLADNPRAYYRLGEATGLATGADSAGGALLNYGSAATLGAAGAIAADPDTAVTANGGCCLGDAPAALPVNNAARSVEAWVKPSDSYQRWLLGWGGSATDRAFNVGLAGDAILVSGYGDDLSFTAPSSLADGLWHHLVITYSAGTATVYVDGAAVGTQSFAHPLNTMPTSLGLRLGSAHDGGGGFYGGLDDVAVYPTALTAAQVAAHYAAGTS